MADGKQVEKRIIQSRNIFLEQIKREIHEQEQYNVQAEFEKTRKNKNYRVLIITLLTLISFLVLISIMNAIVRNRYELASIDITTFQNANLRELLDITKQLEAEIALAVQKREELLMSKNLELEELSTQLERDVTSLSTQSMLPAEFKRRADALRTEHSDAVAMVENKYDVQIAAQDAIILRVRNDLNSYDTQQLEIARRQEEVLANERRLYTIELELLSSTHNKEMLILRRDHAAKLSETETYYTSLVSDLKNTHAQELATTIDRLDPQLPKLDALLADSQFSKATTETSFTNLRENTFLSSDDVQGEEAYHGQFVRIVQTLKNLPYENDVSSSLEHIETRYQNTVLTYHNFIDNLSNLLVQYIDERDRLQLQVDRQLFAFQSLSSANRENGYIIDPRNEDDIMIYVDDAVPVDTESIGYVFRDNDILIATVNLLPYTYHTRAALMSYNNTDVSIQPFDTLLISWEDSGERDIFSVPEIEYGDEPVEMDLFESGALLPEETEDGLQDIDPILDSDALRMELESIFESINEPDAIDDTDTIEGEMLETDRVILDSTDLFRQNENNAPDDVNGAQEEE